MKPAAPISRIASIPGVDTMKGMTMTGGTEAGYRTVLSMFRKDAQDRLLLLHGGPPEPDALPAFITQVHALKSALASIGAADVSAAAAKLEAAGKAWDVASIRDNLGGFAAQLEELVHNIGTFLDHPTGNKGTSAEASEYIPVLQKLAEALESQDASEIEIILSRLESIPLDGKARETMEKISDDVLMTEFDSALKTVKELIASRS